MEPHRVPLRSDVLSETIHVEAMLAPTIVCSAGLVAALPHHPRAWPDVTIEDFKDGLWQMNEVSELSLSWATCLDVVSGRLRMPEQLGYNISVFDALTCTRPEVWQHSVCLCVASAQSPLLKQTCSPHRL